MAEEFPQAEFVGVSSSLFLLNSAHLPAQMDLVPIQPDDIPENVSFVIDDFVAGLPFPPESFDMVHVRQLCFGVSDYTTGVSISAADIGRSVIILLCSRAAQRS